MVTARQVKPKREQKQNPQEVVEIGTFKAALLETVPSVPSAVEWVVGTKGEGERVANLFSQSYVAMLRRFPDTALRATNLTDINRFVFHTKLTAPLVLQFELGAEWIDGGKDLRIFTVQQILLSVIQARPEAFLFFMNDLTQRFLAWKPEEHGHPSKNRLKIQTNTNTKTKVEAMQPPTPRSIAELLNQFIQREGFTEEQFLDLFPVRRHGDIRAFLSGEKQPDDAELNWLGFELSKPGDGAYDDPGRDRYELRELQALRDAATPPAESAAPPVKSDNGKQNGAVKR